MAQLTSADAGFEDAGSYTASSPFQYNAEAFGKNIPYIGADHLAVNILAFETASFKTNPFVPDVEGVNVAFNAHNLEVVPLTSQHGSFKASPFNKYAEVSINATIQAQLLSIANDTLMVRDTSTVFKTPLTGVSGERTNVKQRAVNGSDVIVRSYAPRAYVWGLHDAKRIPTDFLVRGSHTQLVNFLELQPTSPVVEIVPKNSGWIDPPLGSVYLWRNYSEAHSSGAVGTVKFQKIITLDKVTQIEMLFSVDDDGKVYVNGELVISHTMWSQIKSTFFALPAGTNRIVIVNSSSTGGAGCALAIRDTKTGEVIAKTDSSWTITTNTGV